MISDATSKAASWPNRPAAIWWWALAGLAVGFIAVNGQSLWVDEALTATEVSRSTLAGMWHSIAQDKGSDLQMPLYLLHLWAWVKIFGSSEWTLRSVNILWFAAGFTAWMAAFGKRGGAMAMALPLLLSSFAWYFVNEARPYAMQIGSGLMAFAAVMALGRIGQMTGASRHRRAEGDELGGRTWLLVFCVGLIGLAGSSLLGMIWAGGYLLAAVIFLSPARLANLLRTCRLTIGTTAFLLLVLAGYYVWTLKIGARATGGTTDVRNLAFIIYELLGFGGLGPGRLEIRESTAGSFSPYAAPLLIYGVLLAVMGWCGWGRMWQGIGLRGAAALLLALGIPSVVLIGAGYGLHFRVLERHFAPALPLVLWIIGVGVMRWWSGGKLLSRAVVAGFLLLSLVSCLEMRFAVRHEKDDYRDAAAMAKQALARGETVWWNAGWHGAVYYDLPLSTNATAKTALWVLNPATEQLAPLASPGVVVTSKPDMFDAQGGVGEFLRKGPYARVGNYPAFTVWRREKAKNEHL